MRKVITYFTCQFEKVRVSLISLCWVLPGRECERKIQENKGFFRSDSIMSQYIID